MKESRYRKGVVSVLAVCFNQEEYVEEALDSIAGQTYSAIDLVIADDCSSDGSVARIQEWRQSASIPSRLILNRQNLGLCATINRAMQDCTGEFLQIVACDDILDDRKIEVQVRAIEGNQELVLAWSNFRIIGDDGAILNPRYYPEGYVPPADSFIGILSKAKTGMIVLHAPTILVKRQVIDEFGPFPESYLQEDFFIWLNVTFHYGVYFSSDVLISYRKRQSSLARSMTKDLVNRKKMLSDQLAVIDQLIPLADGSRLEALIAAKLERYSGLQRAIATHWQDPSAALAEIDALDSLKKKVTEAFPTFTRLVDKSVSDTGLILWKGGLPYDASYRSSPKDLPRIMRLVLELHLPPRLVLGAFRIAKLVAQRLGHRPVIKT